MSLPSGLESTLLHSVLSLKFFVLSTILIGILITPLLYPRHFQLRRRGLDLLLEGKPAKAEKCFRTALGLKSKLPEAARVRLLVCLGEALMDQGRYEDAQPYLAQALELGDPTGSGQTSMCDLLLAQKASPEKAIQLIHEAMQLEQRDADREIFGARWAAVRNQLLEATTRAREARALLLLGRQAEAREAVDRALDILGRSKPDLATAYPEPSSKGTMVLGHRLERMRRLVIADAYWRVGLSLLAMSETDRAAEHFLVVRDTDEMGKYRSLARRELESLGYTGTK